MRAYMRTNIHAYIHTCIHTCINILLLNKVRPRSYNSQINFNFRKIYWTGHDDASDNAKHCPFPLHPCIAAVSHTLTMYYVNAALITTFGS